jgi:hypothetical protein
MKSVKKTVPQNVSEDMAFRWYGLQYLEVNIKFHLIALIYSEIITG